MKKHLFLVCCAALGISSALTSCAEGDPVYLDPQITAAAIELSSTDSQVSVNTDKTKATAVIDFEGGEVVVSVASTLDEWTYEVTDENDRFSVVKSKNNLTISAAENNSPDDTYSVSVAVTTGKGSNTATALISVTQGTATPTIYYNIEDQNVTRDGNVLNIELGNGTALIENVIISSNFGDWTFNDDIDEIGWLTFEKDLSWMVLRAPQNMNYVDLSGTFTLTIGEGSQEETITVNVTQKKLNASLTIAKSPRNTGTIELTDGKSASNNDVSSAGDKYIFDITSAGAWSYSLSEENTEVNTVSINGSELTYTVTPNSSKDQKRNLTLTISAGVEGNSSTATVVIQQRSFVDDNANLKPMTLEITTSGAGELVYLPLFGAINCYIDWGDGSEEQQYTGSNPTITAGTAAKHTYVDAGKYNVVVTGKVSSLDCLGVGITSGFSEPNTYLTGVVEWGNTGLTSMWRAFQNCGAFKSLPASDEYDAFKEVTSFQSAFQSCTNLISIPAYLFKNNGFNTTGTNAAYCLSNTFSGCTSLTEIPEDLFKNCTSVTAFSGIFTGCIGLTSIPEGLFANNTKVTTFANAFQNCSGLSELPGDLFKYNTAVTTFANTFQGCVDLTELPGNLFEKNTEVTTFASTFLDCSGLIELPATLFSTNTMVSLFTNTFQNCSALTTVPTSIFDNNKAVERFSNAFNGCTKWEGESPYYTGTDPKIHLYERSVGDAGGTTKIYSQPFHVSSCFKGCTNLDDYGSIPTGWGGA